MEVIACDPRAVHGARAGRLLQSLFLDRATLAAKNTPSHSNVGKKILSLSPAPTAAKTPATKIGETIYLLLFYMARCCVNHTVSWKRQQ